MCATAMLVRLEKLSHIRLRHVECSNLSLARLKVWSLVRALAAAVFTPVDLMRGLVLMKLRLYFQLLLVVSVPYAGLYVPAS